MKLLQYIFINIVETFLRLFPFSTKTGLIRIGNPDKNSPILLTCNFHLTVERLKRALRGTDVYLLVANSRGINVWCAAAGGHFTSHDAISAIKTSGIEELVEHRKIILPQLAAPGIEAKTVQQKTGWKVIWGPVYAKDIPAFIKNNFRKNPEMREVKFPWTQRLEMAAAWAFPISVISSLIMLVLWRTAILRLTLLIWGMAFLIFLSFPLYNRWLVSKGRRIGFIFFDFGHGGFQLILWGLFILGLLTYSLLLGEFSWGYMLRWGFISLAVLSVLSLDLMGSTPVYKSGVHKDISLTVTLDESKCKGAGFCEQVCPRNCYGVSKQRHITTIPRADKCVQCGACIVQCPFDALYFKDSEGKILPPETIRKFKLNLKGRRAIKVEGK